jgi:hypothetical protein
VWPGATNRRRSHVFSRSKIFRPVVSEQHHRAKDDGRRTKDQLSVSAHHALQQPGAVELVHKGGGFGRIGELVDRVLLNRTD